MIGVEHVGFVIYHTVNTGGKYNILEWKSRLGLVCSS